MAARRTFLLRAHRDEATARRFLERATDLHGVPEKITMGFKTFRSAHILIAAIETMHMIRKGQGSRRQRGNGVCKP